MPNINTGNFNRIFNSIFSKGHLVKKPSKAQPCEKRPDSENPSAEQSEFSDGKKASALFNDSGTTSTEGKKLDSTDVAEDTRPLYDADGKNDHIKPLGNNLDEMG